MKRIVFCTIGSLGDLHPYIAIARALRARGHQAVIATTDRYRAAVLAAGIEYARLRPDEAEFGGLEAVAAKLFDPYRGPAYLVREMIMPHIREQYEDIDAACAGADLLVTHPLTLAGPLVCAKSGLPWASSILAPASLMSATDRPLIASAAWAHAVRRLGPAPYHVLRRLAEMLARRWERPLDALRAELGLPAAHEPALLRGQFSPRLNLALFPRLLAEPQADWPTNTVLAGFPRFDGMSADTRLRAELDAFLAAGDPPVVFALGSSVVMLAGDFWDKAIDASARLGRRAILLTGTPLSRALPAGVKAFDYLPYSSVFPKAAAIVHQAGIGTLAQAFAAGRPQLIVPVAYDQPDNARRAVGLGLARSIPIRKVTAAGLAAELGRLLAAPEYAARARDAASGLDDGASRGADALLASIS
ncbi:MAG: glycosyltransferase [Proteobacteria bacterium]|nr:glycosyltransferase [Pseudomonadota bacterium]